MATFPSDPVPIFPVTIEQEWKTVITGMDGQNEQRKQKSAFARYNATVKYTSLSKSEIRALWDFYRQRCGALEAFWFFDLVTDDWDGIYVAVSDGEATIWDLPGKSTSAQTIYLNGAECPEGYYTILEGGGDGGADRIQSDIGAWTAGMTITADFTGYLRCKVRFAQDKMTRELFTAALFTTGLELKGLAPDV